MRKVLILGLLVLGTATFANAKPVSGKSTITKETVVRKHKKAIKKAKRVETVKPEAAKATK